jgi:hypothetical protein
MFRFFCSVLKLVFDSFSLKNFIGHIYRKFFPIVWRSFLIEI